MPIYADAPLPPGLASVTALGVNQVKLAILCALAEAGGELTTAELSGVFGGDVAGTTIMRNLNELEAALYIAGDLPHHARHGRRTTWTLNEERLHADLKAMITATTRVRDPEAGQLGD